MAANIHKRSFPPSSWTVAASLWALPLIIVFACFGDLERGRAAWFSALIIALVTKYFWDLRERVWFWIIIATIVVAHVCLIVFIQWQPRSLSYVALLPIAYLDFYSCYGIIRLVEKVVVREGPIPELKT